MKISDILGMSLSNLWRRKMRTVLTVLGVIIGTASIVVMLSLGIGLKEAMMKEVGSAGGLTQIMVYSDEGGGMPDLLLGDDTVNTFMAIDHVDSVQPQLAFYMPVQSGKYESYFYVLGVTPEYLKEIPVGEGELPESSNTVLNLLAGNQTLADFYDYTTGEYPYWENEELPNIDLLTAPLVGGIESEYYESDDEPGASAPSKDSAYIDPAFRVDKDDDDDDDEYDFGDGIDDFSNEDDFSVEDDFGYDDNISYSSFGPDTKRVSLKVSGITEGDMDTYTEYSWNHYTDLESLKTFLRQNYSQNTIIPGQPTDKDGKPYRDIKYSQMVIKVDKSDNVEDVQQQIQDMGYYAEANKEWLEEIEKEFMIIEAVLGGIGAVAMLVAAISIANTMTMSTYERTKEIGIMKVLGCGLGNIRSMFLAEAAFIGFLGGVMGILLSYGLSLLANKVIAPMAMSDYGAGTKISVIPIWLVVTAIIFSTIIGMLAGFFPAQRATKLSPLAAIRND